MHGVYEFNYLSTKENIWEFIRLKPQKSVYFQINALSPNSNYLAGIKQFIVRDD
jgi:hypothetical protein